MMRLLPFLFAISCGGAGDPPHKDTDGLSWRCVKACTDWWMGHAAKPGDCECEDK